jgi:hypothetical protein
LSGYQLLLLCPGRQGLRLGLINFAYQLFPLCSGRHVLKFDLIIASSRVATSSTAMAPSPRLARRAACDPPPALVVAFEHPASHLVDEKTIAPVAEARLKDG